MLMLKVFIVKIVSSFSLSLDLALSVVPSLFSEYFFFHLFIRSEFKIFNSPMHIINTSYSFRLSINVKVFACNKNVLYLLHTISQIVFYENVYYVSKCILLAREQKKATLTHKKCGSNTKPKSTENPLAI